jgi:F-type H+-transporting ATPase subunit b
LKRTLLPILIVTVSLVASAAPAREAEAHQDHTLLWKVVDFVILAGALGYFVRKKGGAFFAARTEGIRRGLEEAARMHEEAQARYAEMERRLANIGAEIESLRAQARQESGAEGERARREAERDIGGIQARAEQEIATAVKAARQQLRVYAAELAVSLAERKIRERLTPESESALLGVMLQDLEGRTDTQARVS